MCFMLCLTFDVKKKFEIQNLLTHGVHTPLSSHHHTLTPSHPHTRHTFVSVSREESASSNRSAQERWPEHSARKRAVWPSLSARRVSAPWSNSSWRELGEGRGERGEGGRERGEGGGGRVLVQLD